MIYPKFNTLFYKRQNDTGARGSGTFTANIEGQTPRLEELINSAQVYIEIMRNGQKNKKIVDQFEELILEINKEFLNKLEANEEKPNEYVHLCVSAYYVFFSLDFDEFKTDLEELKEEFYTKAKNKIKQEKDIKFDNRLKVKLTTLAEKMGDKEFFEYLQDRFSNLDGDFILGLKQMINPQTLDGKIRKLSPSLIILIGEECKTINFWLNYALPENNSISSENEIDSTISEKEDKLRSSKKRMLSLAKFYFDELTEEAQKQFPMEDFKKTWYNIFKNEFNESNFKKELKLFNNL